MVVQALLIEAGIAAAGKLTESISHWVDAFDNAQKDSFAVGLTLGEAKASFAKDIKGLRGTIETKFAGQMELLHAGLQGNTGGIGKLVNQQKLTEQSSEGTGKLMMALEAQLGASRDSTSRLSTDLLFTANKYGVTTESLVDSLRSLERNFVTLNVAGADASVVAGINEVMAMTKGSEKEVTAFVNLLTDTSEEAFAKVAKLGLLAERDAFLKSQSSEEATARLVEMMGKAGSRFTSVSDSSADAMVGMMAATNTFGSEAAGAWTAFQRVGQRLENVNQVESGDILSNRFAEFTNVVATGLFNLGSQTKPLHVVSVNPPASAAINTSVVNRAATISPPASNLGNIQVRLTEEGNSIQKRILELTEESLNNNGSLFDEDVRTA